MRAEAKLDLAPSLTECLNGTGLHSSADERLHQVAPSRPPWSLGRGQRVHHHVLDLFRSQVRVAALPRGRRVGGFRDPRVLAIGEEDTYRMVSVGDSRDRAPGASDVDLLVSFGAECADPTPDGFGVTQGRRLLFDAKWKSTSGCQ